MSSSPLSHYALLSLPPSATPEQIRSSYLRLVRCGSSLPATDNPADAPPSSARPSQAKDLHPDRAAPERRREATETFQALAEAYRVLSDPALRAAYDATLSLSLSLPLSHSAARAPPPPPRHPASPPRFDPHYGPSHGYRAAPDPGSSPFPGFRVPPGGYPSQPVRAHPPRHERGAGPPLALDPLRGLDPLSDLLDSFGSCGLDGGGGGALAGGGGGGAGARWRLPEERRWDAGLGGGRGGGFGAWDGWYGGGGGGPGGERPGMRRREWNEGWREANGEGVSVQGMEEVEHGADGSVRWRGESVTVMYGPLPLSYPPSAGRTSAHARALPPPPPPPPHRPPCRAASPARGAQLALAAHAHAHASPVVGAWSPSAVPRGRPRRASGGAGMGLARQEQQQGVVRADSPLFG